MPVSTAASSYWGFMDEAESAPVILELSSRAFLGDKMIRELTEGLEIDFGNAKIDFKNTFWDFSGVTELPVSRSDLQMNFDDDASGILRLYLLCLVVWRTSKVQTCIRKAKIARAVFDGMGIADMRRGMPSWEEFEKRLSDISDKSASWRYSNASGLLEFLRFRQTYFNVPNDSRLMTRLEAFSAKLGHRMWSQDGVDSVPDEYLVPLVETCLKTIRSSDSNSREGITAAAALLASQIGMRASELVALEVESLHKSSIPGEPEIAFMTFKTFKGSKGDNAYKVAETIVNPIALEAYLWLLDKCAADRERLGTRALLVSHKQSGKYLTKGSLAGSLKVFVASHFDSIPSIDTAERFPELKTTTLEKVINLGIDPKYAEKLNELPSDTQVVYPVFHQFRATVATKLYEAGVDMHYIKRHMSHISEDTTAGYIHSDKELDRQNSETVYKAVFGEGASVLGVHGDEFRSKVESYVSTLDEKVKADLDAVAAAAAKKYPLRRKVGGFCIRCGNIVPCHSAEATDSIYCSFGVCPNQCSMYFLLPDSLDSARKHIALVERNRRDGFTKAAANELRKAQNVIRDVIDPEIESFKEQLEKLGRNEVVRLHSDLADIADSLEKVEEEVKAWKSMKL